MKQVINGTIKDWFPTPEADAQVVSIAWNAIQDAIRQESEYWAARSTMSDAQLRSVGLIRLPLPIPWREKWRKTGGYIRDILTLWRQ